MLTTRLLQSVVAADITHPPAEKSIEYSAVTLTGEVLFFLTVDRVITRILG